MTSKLAIVRCTVSDTTVSTTGDSFSAMINPASLARGYSIAYGGGGAAHSKKSKSRQAPIGQTSAESKFSAVNAETVGFELVLDGTGVVSHGQDSEEVGKQVERLKKIVYDYDGDQHEPNVVRLIWGELDTFDGRLQSMDIDYTMFRPDGAPLRAKVKLRFVSFMTFLEAAVRAKRSSPDLTHEVVVREGDELSMLCHRLYGDASQYLKVARDNGLTEFRHLEPGTVLEFRPLD